MWFIENPWPPILILLVLAGVSGFLWTRQQKRHWLLVCVISLLLCPVAYLADQLVVTEVERIADSMQELAELVRQGDREGVVERINPDAVLLRTKVSAAMLLYAFDDDLIIKDVDVSIRDRVRAKVRFRANGTGRLIGGSSGHRVATRWDVVLVKKDGQWKIDAATRLHPIENRELEILSPE